MLTKYQYDAIYVFKLLQRVDFSIIIRGTRKKPLSKRIHLI